MYRFHRALHLALIFVFRARDDRYSCSSKPSYYLKQLVIKRRPITLRARLATWRSFCRMEIYTTRAASARRIQTQYRRCTNHVSQYVAFAYAVTPRRQAQNETKEAFRPGRVRVWVHRDRVGSQLKPLRETPRQQRVAAKMSLPSEEVLRRPCSAPKYSKRVAGKNTSRRCPD